MISRLLLVPITKVGIVVVGGLGQNQDLGSGERYPLYYIFRKTCDVTELCDSTWQCLSQIGRRLVAYYITTYLPSVMP